MFFWHLTTFWKIWQRFDKSVAKQSDFLWDLEKKKRLLLRCPKLIKLFERQASRSKIMFYRDTQALVIHISRGTCTRGDIVIHISFALAQHISQRGLKKGVWILHIFKCVVLELYESPRNPAWRITSFLFLPLNAIILFVGSIEKS